MYLIKRKENRMKLSQYQAIERKTNLFNRWLKGKLAENDLSQTELAEALGISKQALSHRLRNRVPFDYVQMLIIFQFLDASTEDKNKLMTL